MSDNQHLDNWEKDAIMVEVQVIDAVYKLNLKQTKMACPWCGKRHLVITDKSATASGHMLCDGCGQFFKWSVQMAEGYAERSRVKAMKLKAPAKAKHFRGKS